VVAKSEDTGTASAPVSSPFSFSTPDSGAAADGVAPRFTDLAAQAGIDFTFYNDPVPDRFFLPEVMGGGAAWVDFDGDGQLDLYLMNGSELGPGQRTPPSEPHTNRLYRNVGHGQFQEVTHLTGTEEFGYGQGCSVGDFDGDGFPDLYLTNYGANVLLRNLGDGTFEDITDLADVGDPLWSTGAIWIDLDDDGLLDLYVVNYLDVTLANSKKCMYETGVASYCGPGEYQGQPDRAYRNLGDGRFEEASEKLGLASQEGKGLAVAAVDFNHDLRPEIYVANDMWANFLFTRDTAHRLPASAADQLYADVAIAAGAAFADNGNNEASMGIACGDFDGDGLTDIFLTHFYKQKNTLYRNLGSLLFQDDSRRTRIAATSFDSLGFGTVPFDFDRDGTLDLFVANGHVLGPLVQPNEMFPQLLRNQGGAMFVDISSAAGDYFQQRWLGRAAVAGDYNNDGHLDILVTHLDRPVVLLRNETETDRAYLGLKLTTPSRLPPLGGRVVIRAGDRQWSHSIVAGGSYLASHDDRLLMGLGDHQGPVDVEVHWPSGVVDVWRELEPNQYWHLGEGGLLRPMKEARSTP
jgi:enediyne biosynthesis protein E4